MYEFEKHPKLTEFIQEMALTGKAPQEWTSFIETLNEALRIHDVSSLLKAEREATKEEIREWLRGEDFEGLAERL